MIRKVMMEMKIGDEGDEKDEEDDIPSQGRPQRVEQNVLRWSSSRKGQSSWSS